LETGDSPPQIIVLGPPGAGKGTQASRLAERLGLVHVSPGRILREHVATGSREAEQIRELMTAGELVPDELIDRMVRGQLEALAPDQGFVLDGYPRTPNEARSLHGTLAQLGRLDPRPVAVWLEVPREVLAERLRHRRTTQDRPDDSDAAVTRRLEIDEAQAEPLRKALAGFTDSVTIDGNQPPDAITDEILRAVAQRMARARDSETSFQMSDR
jgi:adenylate kinase